MVGNREITEHKRREYWELFESAQRLLPNSVVTLVKQIDQLNSTHTVGFRRRNLPALLGKYFLDMREVLGGIGELLRPSASAFVVVGDNSTVAGGERITINTAALLADVGKGLGLRLRQTIPMEMLVSRDIFKKNAMRSEVILHLTRS